MILQLNIPDELAVELGNAVFSNHADDGETRTKVKFFKDTLIGWMKEELRRYREFDAQKTVRDKITLDFKDVT